MTLDPKSIDEPHQLAGGSGALGPFFRNAYQAKLPLNVQLQITDLCNLRCEHCYNSLEHKDRELSFDEIVRILGEVKAAGALYLCLTGGEPMLHPRFADIAREVRKAGLCLEIITNATLIKEEHYALFHELKPHYIAVSLHGIQRASHESLTGISGSFDKTKQAIERLHAEGLPVQLRIPITRYNANEVDDLLMYAEALGVEYRFDCNITYREDGDPTSSGVRADLDVVQGVYDRKWADRLQKGEVPAIGRQEHLEAQSLCAAGHNFCYIDSVGTLHPCPSFQRPAGSLREQSFKDVWYDSDFFKSLRDITYGDIEGCSGCSDMAYCNFCPGDARLEGKDKDNGFANYERACNNAALNREAYERADQANKLEVGQ